MPHEGRRWRSLASWLGRARVTGWVLLAGCVVSGIAVFALDARTTALQQHGMTTEATLVEVHTGARGHRAYVVAEYTTASGRWVHTEVDTFAMHPTPHPGETARVLYDPAHPRSNVVDARLGPDVSTEWFLTGLSLVSGALMVPTFRRGVRWDHLFG